MLKDTQFSRVRVSAELRRENDEGVFCICLPEECSGWTSIRKKFLFEETLLLFDPFLQELYKSTTIHQYIMKTFTLLALAGTAAAFAPAPQQVR